jgi:hypothetical protein
MKLFNKEFTNMLITLCNLLLHHFLWKYLCIIYSESLSIVISVKYTHLFHWHCKILKSWNLFLNTQNQWKMKPMAAELTRCPSQQCIEHRTIKKNYPHWWICAHICQCTCSVFFLSGFSGLKTDLSFIFLDISWKTNIYIYIYI